VKEIYYKKKIKRAKDKEVKKISEDQFFNIE